MSTAGKGEADNIQQSKDHKFPAEKRVGNESTESPTLANKDQHVGSQSLSPNMSTQGINPANTVCQTSHVSGVKSTNRNSKTSTTGSQLPSCIPQERQVIAVSASKNPAAFFNLARRFLVTDEYCDLSALEGAIVSAVDAAHLLERSKLAKIVRVETSYVSVEPRKKNASVNIPAEPSISAVPSAVSFYEASQSTFDDKGQRQNQSPNAPNTQLQLEQSPENKPNYRKKGSQVRRARIVITVKRTDEYKLWLEEHEADTASETTGDHVDIGALGKTLP